MTRARASISDFPAFDSQTTNHGVAVGLDGERVGQLYGQMQFKNVVFTGVYGRRQKDVPTASFGTLFNEHQPKEESTDRHTLADVEYSQKAAGGHLTLRGSFDRFSYDGAYPFDGSPGPVIVGINSALGTRWSGEARLERALPHRQLVTIGVEYIDNVHQNQDLRYVDDAAQGSDSTALPQQAVYCRTRSN